MRKTTQEIGAYGVENGLGFHGVANEKAMLVRRVGRAIDRGDLGLLAEYLAAYGVGTYAGSRLKQLALETSTELARWG